MLKGRAQETLSAYYPANGGRKTLFYCWGRTVQCSNPSCRAEVPLVGTFFLSKKANEWVYFVPEVSGQEVRFHIQTSAPLSEGEFDPSTGTITRANAQCLVCNQVVSGKYIKAQGGKGGLGHRLLAVAVNGPSGRIFVEPRAEDWQALKSVPSRSDIEPIGGVPAVPTEPLPNDSRAFFVYLYGLSTWGDLYNERQAYAMTVFARLVNDLLPEVRQANRDLGTDADEFAKAVVTYLGLCCSRLSGFASSIAILKYAGGRGVNHTFRLQAIPMTWDYAETNPLNDSAASWSKSLSDMLRALPLLEFAGASEVRRASADRLPFDSGSFDAVITDPPYYDAVPYSDLSDYFYVWLRRCLGSVYPEALSTELTPKRNEMVQNPAHNKTCGVL